MLIRDFRVGKKGVFGRTFLIYVGERIFREKKLQKMIRFAARLLGYVIFSLNFLLQGQGWRIFDFQDHIFMSKIS